LSKCDHCDSRATIHVTEIVHGTLQERHFCEEHACQSVGEEYLRLLPPFPFEQMEEETLKRLMGAFEEAGISGAVPAFIKLLKDDDRSVRYYAAGWLGQMGSAAKDAIPHLRALLEDEDEHVRRVAKEALARIER
jgi:hypothetical protein